MSKDEISMAELLRRMWCGRRILFFTVILSVVAACIVVFVAPRQYSARCEFVSQSSSSELLPRISSIVSLAGIAISPPSEQGAISPILYENIIFSQPFMDEIVHTPLEFACDGCEYSLVEYLARARGQDSSFDKIAAWVSKNMTEQTNNRMTEEQKIANERIYSAMKYFRKQTTVEYDEVSGCVGIEVTLPDAVAAASLARSVVSLLEQYVIDIRTRQAKNSLQFIQERYDEARMRFDSLQYRRALFMDSNQNTTKHVARAQIEQLDAEYELASSIYRELSMQLEQAMISVKEQTPILSIISPVTVPFKASKPRKMIIFITFVALGFLVGGTLVLTLPYAAMIMGRRAPKYADWLPKRKRQGEEVSDVE